MASLFPPPPFDFVMCEHPYVVEGNKMPSYFEVTTVNGDPVGVQRVDLPGLNKETLRVWAEKDAICIEGEDAKDDEEFDKESPRKFRGKVPLFNDKKHIYKTDDLKYVVKDGVLKLLIPFKNN